MNNIAIIPARGGSKRIPRKNIKEFLGKPIIAYSIEAALKSNLFNEVMVSTDDDEIAEIAMKYGAKVPFMRSEKNANDYATTYDVLEEVILYYKKQGNEFDNGCCIYPCAPFITEKKLNEAYYILNEEGKDCVFPVIQFSFPIQRALKIDDGRLKMFNENFITTRTQDLEKSYHDSGQFYWFKIKEILKNKRLLTKNIGGIIISEVEGQDIDNVIDWNIAELKYKLINEIS